MTLNNSAWESSTTIHNSIEEDILDDEDEVIMDEDDEEYLEDESTYTSSPSIPDENIDFDLVYTLHSFEATVDGQASVQKGNALTLLDDSNSYWWLIRDLKTSEVGYIPAENIETPFERLARLNKHRNVQLTSSEHAPFYTTDVKPSYIRNRRVTMSTSLFVQAQILLVDDNEEIEDETYETWNEKMNDEDDENEKETKDSQQQQRHQQYMDDILSGIGVIGEGREEGASLKTTNKNQTSPFIENEKEEVIPFNSKVLRVFAGNINVGASYHSVRVVESTSVSEMLAQAMEKFRLSEIETQQGYSMHNSCVEYYLAIKSRDGHEITLDPKDKPLAIFESLTSHLTTPMPSLTNIKQLSKGPTKKQDQEKTTVKNKKKKHQQQQQDDINTFHFYIHKRIKHVNDRSGQVHVKISLLTQPIKGNKMRKMSQFRLSKKKKPKPTERIDKLIAIPAGITIADLTNTALEKFHIISNVDQPHHYRILLQTDGKESLLSPSHLLNQVLENIEDRENCFVLKNFSTQIEERPISLSSSSSSSSYNNRPASIMKRIDSSTENAFKRIDTVVETFEDPVNHSQKNSANHSSYSTALSDNDKSGLVDRYPYMDNENVSHSLLESHTKDTNLSSLDDLEKELQRILTSHTS